MMSSKHKNKRSIKISKDDKERLTPSDQKRNNNYETECSMINNPHEREDTIINTDVNDNSNSYGLKKNTNDGADIITIEDLKVNDIDLQYNENKGMIHTENVEEEEKSDNSYNSNLTEIR